MSDFRHLGLPILVAPRATLVVALLATLAAGCKKRVTKLDVPQQMSLIGEEKRETPPGKIDTSRMFVVILDVRAEQIRKHYGLKMEVHRTPEPDFYQFYICLQDGGECRPQEASPGTFTLGVHRYDDPPTGKVKGAIRACVSPDLAADSEQPCGPWADFSGVDMPESEDPRLKELFLAREKIKEDNKAECEKFREEVRSFFAEAREQGRMNQETQDQAINMLRMNDLNCEITSSTLYVEAKDAVEEQPPKTEEKGWSTASKVIFGVGAGLAAFGTLKVGYDLLQMRRTPAAAAAPVPKRVGRLTLVEEEEGLGLAGLPEVAGATGALKKELESDARTYDAYTRLNTQMETLLKRMEGINWANEFQVKQAAAAAQAQLGLVKANVEEFKAFLTTNRITSIANPKGGVIAVEDISEKTFQDLSRSQWTALNGDVTERITRAESTAPLRKVQLTNAEMKTNFYKKIMVAFYLERFAADEDPFASTLSSYVKRLPVNTEIFGTLNVTQLGILKHLIKIKLIDWKSMTLEKGLLDLSSLPEYSREQTIEIDKMTFQSSDYNAVRGQLWEFHKRIANGTILGKKYAEEKITAAAQSYIRTKTWPLKKEWGLLETIKFIGSERSAIQTLITKIHDADAVALRSDLRKIEAPSGTVREGEEFLGRIKAGIRATADAATRAEDPEETLRRALAQLQAARARQAEIVEALDKANKADVARLRAEIEAKQTALAAAERRAAAAEADAGAKAAAVAEAEQLRGELAGVRGELAAATARIEGLGAENAGLTARVGELDAQVAAQARQLATAEQATREARARADQAAQELAEEKAKAERLTAEAAAARREADTARAAADEVTRAAGEAGERAAAAERATQVANQERDEARGQAGEARREAEAAKRQKEEAEGRARELEGELERARAAARATATGTEADRAATARRIAELDGARQAALAQVEEANQRAAAAAEKEGAATRRTEAAEAAARTAAEAHRRKIAELEGTQRTALDEATRKAEAAEAKAAAVEEAQAGLQRRLELAEGNAERLRAEAEALKAANTAELEAARAAALRLTEELRVAGQRATEAGRLVADAGERVGRAEGELEGLRQQLAAAELRATEVGERAGQEAREAAAAGQRHTEEMEVEQGRSRALQAELEAKQAELEGARGELEAAGAAHAQELAAKDVTIGELRAANAAYRWRLAAANGRTARAEADILEQKRVIAGQGEVLAKQNAELLRLGQELDAATKAGAAGLATTERLTSELEALRGSHAEALARQATAATSLQQPLDEQLAENKRLTRELAGSKREWGLERSRLNAENSLLRAELASLGTKNERLRQDLAKALGQVSSLAARHRQEIAGLQTELETARAQGQNVADLEARLKVLNQSLRIESYEVVALGQANQDLQRTNEALRHRLAGSEADSAALRSQLAEVSQRLATQDAASAAERKGWEAEKADLERRVADAEESARKSDDAWRSADAARARGLLPAGGDTLDTSSRSAYGADPRGGGGMPLGGFAMMLGGMSLMAWAMGREGALGLAEDDPFQERIEEFKERINEISDKIDSNNAAMNGATVDILQYYAETYPAP